MGQCCPNMLFPLCDSNIDRACRRATVLLFAVRLQPLPASGEKLQQGLRFKHNGSIIATRFLSETLMEVCARVCLCLCVCVYVFFIYVCVRLSLVSKMKLGCNQAAHHAQIAADLNSSGTVLADMIHDIHAHSPFHLWSLETSSGKLAPKKVLARVRNVDSLSGGPVTGRSSKEKMVPDTGWKICSSSLVLFLFES